MENMNFEHDLANVKRGIGKPFLEQHRSLQRDLQRRCSDVCVLAMCLCSET